MKNTLKISLRPNEKIYLNGAVIRTDRKVTIELLNDVQFLLESHVLQAADASTPLRQLYFMVQMMLIDPQTLPQARELFRKTLPLLIASFSDPHVCATLKHVDQLVSELSYYEALKAIRSLYEREARAILDANEPAAETRRAAVGDRY